MHQYTILVFCDHCSVPHPVGITIGSKHVIWPGQNVADAYDGRELPPELVSMTNNFFQCPKTGKMFKQTDNSQLFMVRLLKQVKGQHFKNTDVHLSGHDYRDCTFEHCRIIFDGSAPFRLSDSSMSHCHIVPTGAAHETLRFLKMMHAAGSEGKAVIESLFDDIRQPPSVGPGQTQ